MTDYRDLFYSKYHLTLGQSEETSVSLDPRIARQFLNRWGRWLPANKGVPVLDLGCGSGLFLIFLQSLGYQELYGVDRCETELARGRRQGLANLVCANALDYLQGQHERFELITAFHFFEHLNKDEILALLELIHQALRPEGRVLIVTPNGLSPFGGATRYWDFSHETGFTPASWRQLARLYGFCDVRFEEYGPLPHSLLGLIRCGLWYLVRLGLDALSYIEVAGPRDASRVYTADLKVILTK